MKFITVGIIGILYATLAKSDDVANIVENCVVHDENGACSQCQHRFINKNGICQQVNEQCETWDQTSGKCLTCYGGYYLQQGNCVINNDGIPIVISPNADTKCPPRSIPKNGACQAVSDLCNTWDQHTGECLTCYGGYALKQGSCVTEQSQQNNAQASSGSDCPFRTVKKGDKCEAVSDQCNTWDNQTGDCLTCYGGYSLKEGACVAENSTSNQQNHQQTSENCAFRTVKKDGKCEAVSDLCNTWDQVSGQCLTCYGGYALKEGACVVSKNLTFEPSDCPFRAVKINGECKQVSDLCNTWDDSTGDCLTCYGGYNLAQGKCVL